MRRKINKIDPSIFAETAVAKEVAREEQEAGEHHRKMELEPGLEKRAYVPDQAANLEKLERYFEPVMAESSKIIDW